MEATTSQGPRNTTTNVTPPVLSSNDVERLRNFHASHFVNAPIPDIKADDPSPAQSASHAVDAEESLGYYDDGVRRTLTDDQIRMFRHSEIQRLLLERQQKHEAAEKEAERRERKRKRDAAQQRHFDEPKQDDVNMLVYDDAEPVAKQDVQSVAGEKKFLWPQLGG